MLPNIGNLDQLAIGFTLAVFRVAGLMLFAPLFGSARIPRRFKVLIALVMTLPMVGFDGVSRIPMPGSIGALTVGLLAEIGFGLVTGMAVSLTFIAAQGAGEMIGQQIGLSMSEVLDPQFGAQGSIIGDLYFMLTTAVFLIIGGHRQLVIGVYESMQAFPPLSVTVDDNLFKFLLSFLTGAMELALRLAAPMFVTMIIVDVSMGCVSKTMPQLNVMSAGMAVRGVLGIVVLGFGVSLAAAVLNNQLVMSMHRLDLMISR